MSNFQNESLGLLIDQLAWHATPSSLGGGGVGVGGLKILEKYLLGVSEIFFLVARLYCWGGANFVGGSRNFEGKFKIA